MTNNQEFLQPKEPKERKVTKETKYNCWQTVELTKGNFTLWLESGPQLYPMSVLEPIEKWNPVRYQQNFETLIENIQTLERLQETIPPHLIIPSIQYYFENLAKEQLQKICSLLNCPDLSSEEHTEHSSHLNLYRLAKTLNMDLTPHTPPSEIISPALLKLKVKDRQELLDSLIGLEEKELYSSGLSILPAIYSEIKGQPKLSIGNIISKRDIGDIDQSALRALKTDLKVEHLLDESIDPLAAPPNITNLFIIRIPITKTENEGNPAFLILIYVDQPERLNPEKIETLLNRSYGVDNWKLIKYSPEKHKLVQIVLKPKSRWNITTYTRPTVRLFHSHSPL